MSTYARSKHAGEEYVRGLLNKYYIVRTAWLFGPSRENFVTQIAATLKNGTPTKQVTDMVSTPTFVKDLSEAVAFLIETNLFGTYHLTNSGRFASRYEIALEIAKMMKLPSGNIEKTTLEKLGLPAHRPGFSGLRNFVWELNGWRSLRPWQDAVREFLQNKGEM